MTRACTEWHDSGVHLVERSTVDMPEAPDGISIMGCDAANNTYIRLHSDERGICRIYQMSINEGEWKLWREGEPFPQPSRAPRLWLGRRRVGHRKRNRIQQRRWPGGMAGTAESVSAVR